MTAPALMPTKAVVEGRSAARSELDWWRLGLVLVGALALVAGIAVVDARPVGVFDDDAMYVILARSLASGEGYRWLNLPGAPAATHFPPGYPLLLAAVSWLGPAFPANVVMFKALNAPFLAVAAVLVARLAYDRAVGASWALGLGAASAVSIPLLVLGSMVLSELLFLAMLIAMLGALETFVEGGGTTRRALLLGAAIAACTLVRSHGVVLVPAVVLALAAQRRWRDAALVAGASVACLLPWQLWSAAHSGQLPAPLLGSYDTYASWWVRGLRVMGPGVIPATLAKTVPETLQMLGVLFSPLRADAARTATLLSLGALAVTGAWSVPRRLPVAIIAAEYAGDISLHPGRPAVPVLSFTTAQYLRDHSAAENATEGLGPILAAYPVRTVIVGNRTTVDAADLLVSSPTPRLALRADFPGGVAYTVLPK